MTTTFQSVPAALVLLVSLVSCCGCGKSMTVTKFIAANGNPLLVSSSAEMKDNTLTLYGPRKVEADAKPIDAGLLKGRTLVYVRNRDEVDKLRLMALLTIPVFSYEGQVDDLLYNMTPPFLMHLKEGEVLIADVSPDGTVTTSEPSNVSVLQLRPDSAKESNQAEK